MEKRKDAKWVLGTEAIRWLKQIHKAFKYLNYILTQTETCRIELLLEMYPTGMSRKYILILIHFTSNFLFSTTKICIIEKTFCIS